METIKILSKSCNACPTVFDVELPNGAKGYIKYRWGIISLKEQTDNAGIFQDSICSEQIGDEFDSTIELIGVIKWLYGKGYNVNPIILENEQKELLENKERLKKETDEVESKIAALSPVETA